MNDKTVLKDSGGAVKLVPKKSGSVDRVLDEAKERKFDHVILVGIKDDGAYIFQSEFIPITMSLGAVERMKFNLMKSGEGEDD